MDFDFLEKQKQAVVDKFGPWTASNIHLDNDCYTIGKKIEGDEIKLRRVLQIVSDAARKPFRSLRLLDLACHEGIYAIEFARHGASVVGIEGREAHIEKAKFVKDVLSLNNLDIFQDDVRNLSSVISVRRNTAVSMWSCVWESYTNWTFPTFFPSSKV